MCKLLTDFSLHSISDIDTSHLDLCVFGFLQNSWVMLTLLQLKCVFVCVCLRACVCVLKYVYIYLNFRASEMLSSTSICSLLQSSVYEVGHQMVMWVFIGQVLLVNVLKQSSYRGRNLFQREG